MEASSRKLVRWSVGIVAVSAALPFVVASFTRILTNEPLLHGPFLGKLAVAFCLWLAFCLILKIFWRRNAHAVERNAEHQQHSVDAITGPRADIAIFLSAALSLFLELSLIRWQGSVFPLFAFYKNLGLLACFAGLGLGYALASRRGLPLILTIPLFGWQFVLLHFLRYSGDGLHARSLMAAPITEQLNMLLPTTERVYQYIPIYFFLASVFLLSALAFVPIGQLCGRAMALRPNLRAYGLNLLGSLAGVLAMQAISALWWPPAVWFALGLGGLLLFQAKSRASLVAGLAAGVFAVVALALPWTSGIHRVYSPYQLVEAFEGERGLTICAAGIHYQVAMDLAPDNPDRAQVPFYRTVARYYELPYVIYAAKQGRPDRIAIVGAGTGNDVAGALHQDVGHVDAIEIDPAILRIGRVEHPERPYDDPRVTAIVNDARSFLRETEQRYDLIVYGFLDSHAALSHAANVRVDSFVYTVEGIAEARGRLKEDGLIALTFNIVSPALGLKIYRMLESAFDGKPPLCVRAMESDYGAVTFLQGNGWDFEHVAPLLREANFEDCTGDILAPGFVADVPTDNWPFFYMPRRVYPLSYLFMAGLIVLLSAWLILGFLREAPRPGLMPFFFLGTGFMLVETKGITELGLTFGNTWQVIGAVIAGVLLMAFLANGVVAVCQLRRTTLVFVLLLASLALGYGIARAGGLPSTSAGRIGTLALLTCPLFFSGLAFSTLLARVEDLPGAMAANIFGAMCGGLLEYNAMYFGYRFLYVLAAALYVLAWISQSALLRGHSLSRRTQV